MGKRIIAQRRGSGSPLYRFPDFKSKAKAKYLPINTKASTLEIVDIVKNSLHSAPLLKLKHEGKEYYHIAAEGVAVGQRIKYYDSSSLNPGDVLYLKQIPEGSLIFNIEGVSGDGGKFVRASGATARIISKTPDAIIVEMPSKKKKLFNPNCRATIGIVAGSGRVDKPFVKAGTKYYYAKAKHHVYPKVSGSAMNAVDHPFGNKRSSRKSKAKPVSRHAPPGRKVGYIAARRTGRKK